MGFNDVLYCRYYVLYRLPRLKFLDSTPVRAEEKLEATKKGAFLKVVRPQDDDLNVSCISVLFSVMCIREISAISSVMDFPYKKKQ